MFIWKPPASCTVRISPTMLATTSMSRAFRNSTVSLNSTSISMVVVAPQPLIITKVLSPAFRSRALHRAPATCSTVSLEDIMGTRTPPPSPCWPAPISMRSVSPRSPKDMPFWGWVASVDLTVREAMLSAYRWAISATSSRLLPSRAAAAAMWYSATAPARPRLLSSPLGSYWISSPVTTCRTLRPAFLASFMACLPASWSPA